VTALLLVSAAVVAVASAVRSTWSPCGLSMLSTITPMTERSRGHRYGVTATWFVLGALVGGATLGGVSAAVAAGVHASGASTTLRLGIAGTLALLAASIDAGSFGVRPPFFKRQVNDDWLRQYRPWVYGAGFGWQIGVGVATYIMTAGVLLTAALAALAASASLALAIGLLFGLLRGSAVFFSARATTPEGLRSLHARFDALESPVRLAVTAVEAVAGITLAAVVSPAAGAVAAVAVVGLALLARPRLTRRTT
jgi:hypothetical protein